MTLAENQEPTVERELTTKHCPEVSMYAQWQLQYVHVHTECAYAHTHTIQNLLRISGCLQTHRAMPAYVFWVLRLKVCMTLHNKNQFYKRELQGFIIKAQKGSSVMHNSPFGHYMINLEYKSHLSDFKMCTLC